MHIRIKLSNPSAYLPKLFKHEKHPTFATAAALLITPDAGLSPLPLSRALDAASDRAPAVAPFHVREQATSTKKRIVLGLYTITNWIGPLTCHDVAPISIIMYK
jgi:hypothetical protein